jgi:hypothetical protein
MGEFRHWSAARAQAASTTRDAARNLARLKLSGWPAWITTALTGRPQFRSKCTDLFHDKGVDRHLSLFGVCHDIESIRQ